MRQFHHLTKNRTAHSAVVWVDVLVTVGMVGVSIGAVINILSPEAATSSIFPKLFMIAGYSQGAVMAKGLLKHLTDKATAH